MKRFNRREFLKTTLLSSTASLFLLSPFEKLFASKTANTEDVSLSDITDIKTLQSKAKEFFFQKEYSKAEQCYRQIIVLSPKYVPGYDGLAKTFYAQNKSLQAAELYRQGWLEYKTSPLFSDRLSKSILRLISGNSEQEKEFCFRIGNNNLLELSAQLYIDAINNNKNKISLYLIYGLLDVQHTIDKLNSSYRNTDKTPIELPLKIRTQIKLLTKNKSVKWKESRRKKKRKEYSIQNEQQALVRQNNTDSKKRRSLYFDDEKSNRKNALRKGKKDLYLPLFEEALAKQSTAKIEKYHQKIVEIDKADKYVKGRLIKHYKSQKMYSKLVAYQKMNYDNSPDFWNTVSYAQALRLQSRKESKKSACNEALNLYNKVTNIPNLNTEEFACVQGGIINCYYQLSQYNQMRETIEDALSNFPGSYIPFVILYIKSWVKESKYLQAENAYKLLLYGEENSSLVTTPIYEHLRLCHKTLREPNENPKNVSGFGVRKEILFDVYYGLADVYRLQKNSLAEKEILIKIKRIDPNCSYLKKHAI